MARVSWVDDPSPGTQECFIYQIAKHLEMHGIPDKLNLDVKWQGLAYALGLETQKLALLNQNLLHNQIDKRTLYEFVLKEWEERHMRKATIENLNEIIQRLEYESTPQKITSFVNGPRREYPYYIPSSSNEIQDTRHSESFTSNTCTCTPLIHGTVKNHAKRYVHWVVSLLLIITIILFITVAGMLSILLRNFVENPSPLQINKQNANLGSTNKPLENTELGLLPNATQVPHMEKNKGSYYVKQKVYDENESKPFRLKKVSLRLPLTMTEFVEAFQQNDSTAEFIFEKSNSSICNNESIHLDMPYQVFSNIGSMTLHNITSCKGLYAIFANHMMFPNLTDITITESRFDEVNMPLIEQFFFRLPSLRFLEISGNKYGRESFFSSNQPFRNVMSLILNVKDHNYDTSNTMNDLAENFCTTFPVIQRLQCDVDIQLVDLISLFECHQLVELQVNVHVSKTDVLWDLSKFYANNLNILKLSLKFDYCLAPADLKMLGIFELENRIKEFHKVSSCPLHSDEFSFSTNSNARNSLDSVYVYSSKT